MSKGGSQAAGKYGQARKYRPNLADQGFRSECCALPPGHGARCTLPGGANPLPGRSSANRRRSGTAAKRLGRQGRIAAVKNLGSHCAQFLATHGETGFSGALDTLEVVAKLTSGVIADVPTQA